MLKYSWKNKPKPSKSGYAFKMMHSFDKRLNESKKLNEKHPNLIPIIVEKSDSSSVAEINKKKMLMSRDATVIKLLQAIRSRIKLDATEAIFIFIDNRTIPAPNSTIGEVYEKYGDKDGFLYVTYSSENTFG